MNEEYPDQRYAICKSKWDKKGDNVDKNESGVLGLVQNSFWCITEEMLQTIYSIVHDHTFGLTHVPQDAFEHKYPKVYEGSKKLIGSHDAYVVQDSVAIIPIVGTIAKRMNLFADISGGTSTELIAKDIRLALKNEDISLVILDIDSPGGTLDGTKALSDMIFQARGKKPIIAFSNGITASAAYWIASAADHIVAEETAIVGSIGVLQIHDDYSKMIEDQGVKRTVIRSGKYKATGNPYEPLTKESKQIIQDQLDYFYGIFINDVSRNLGVDASVVADKMAEGRIFIGKQALDVGMVHEIGTFAHAVGFLNKSAKGQIEASNIIITKGEEDMNLKEFKEKNPDAYAELMAEAKAEVNVEIGPLQAKINILEQEKSNQDTRIKVLEKDGLIRAENERKLAAARIWDVKLAESDVPAYLHDKVRGQISHAQFVDGNGKFDEAAFSEAVDAEILTWPVTKGEQVIGGGSAPTKGTLTDESSKDDAVVERLAAHVKK